MRAYLRHPSEVPIEVSAVAGRGIRPVMRDVSEGGLCCESRERFDVGTSVRVKIPVGDGFETEGTVAWCAPRDGGYRIGIAFADQKSAFSVRMVEQVCHIERYRQHMREREGRELDAETAAVEWIARYAASFPR
jgi:hypothetical protein